jgi:putative transposase
MGRAPPASTNALVVSFWSTLQRELLDRHTRASRTELAVAVFE